MKFPYFSNIVTPILSNLKWSSTSDRMSRIHNIRKIIEEERKNALLLHREGAGGRAVTLHLTGIVNTILEVIFDSFASNRKSEKVESPFFMAAQGGYGRGDLQPFSDIDLIFIFRDSIEGPASETTSHIISLMWDLGFDVGHSSRTLKECINLMKTEITARTSLMTTRYLAGNRDLFNIFLLKIREEVHKKSVNPFLNSIKTDMEERHQKHGGTVFVAEPNVKEGAGGLRDFHTALWACAARFDLHSLEEFEKQGIIDSAEREEVEENVDFLLRIRNELHFSKGRKEDVLRHEFQEEVVSNLIPEKGKDDTYRFMRDYYCAAKHINRFAWKIMSLCLAPSKPSLRLWSRLKKKRLGDGFERNEDKLCMEKDSPDIFRKNPHLLVKVFLICQRHEIPFSDQMKQMISSSLDMITESLFQLPEVKEIWREIIQGKKPGNIFRMMHEVGVLSRILKEFDAVTLYSPRDMYHLCTVDEHTLRALENLEKLSEKGEDAELFNIYTGIHEKGILISALLMHDIGKGKGSGHAERGAVIAARVMKKWGLEEYAGETEQLIRLHLMMSHTAFRRDLSDRKVIEEFCGIIKHTDQLKRLYLLTYADLNAVSPQVWNKWKGSLLRELFLRTYTCLETSEVPMDATLFEQKRKEVLEVLPGRKEDVEEYFSSLPEKYILSLSSDSLLHHVDLVKELKKKKVSTGFFHNESSDFSEMIVCTRGEVGVFSKIAGTLAAHNLNILGGKVYTRKDNIAVDTLQILNPITMERNKPDWDRRVYYREEDMWEQVREDITRVVEGKTRVQDLMNRRTRGGKRKPGFFHLPTRIEIHNDLSDTYTVIEVVTQDQIGVLYLLTDLLFEKGLNLHVAKISTEGRSVIDVFYVTEIDGTKVAGEERLKDIQEGLESVLVSY